MKVSDVTNEDGRMCAALLQLLKVGRWDLSGTEAETLVKTKAWVSTLAMGMAAELKPQASVSPKDSSESPQSFRVKSMSGPAAKTSKSKLATTKKK